MTGKNYFFSTFNTLLLLACLLLQVKGYAQPACTATSISTFAPATGPEGALVTITGQGFSLGAGTTAVQFNGINAVFRAVSDTQIKATVPAGYTTGDIVVITNGCSATRPGFTLLSSVCAPDIYISELYDANGGSYGVIELYNPADTDLVFNGRYVLERYGTIGDDQPSNNYVLVLPGVIASQTTYQVISNNGSPVTCGGTRDASMGSGINASDQFKLRKDGEVIDVANAPGNIGYTVKRRPNVIAPKVAQTNADWIFTSNTCDDIGDHNPGTPPDTNPRITDEPDSIVLCDMQPTVTFSVTISNTAGATYQWKTVNASGAWVNVSGAGFSGATTRTLTVTVPAPPHTSQYYCVITTPNCVLISDAAQLTVSGRPQATFAVSDINCTTNTGTITLTPTPASGAGLTYSLNGGTFQASATFTNVAGGTHTVTVKNADGCTTAIIGIQITIPAIPVTTIAPIVLPDCINLNGILTITAPLGAAYEYSTDGTNFQAGLIFNLPAGSYSITVKNILTGCTSVSGPYV
ncbi:MAG: IPT/TIG domain-containing protein, partial [Bacteroidia bacterium]